MLTLHKKLKSTYPREGTVLAAKMSTSAAAGAGAGQSSVLSTTNLDAPGFRWVSLRKILWQVGLDALFRMRVHVENILSVRAHALFVL